MHGSRTARVALAAMVGLTAALPARGEEAAASGGGWSFALTPYVWFASLEGDVGAISGLPPASVDAGFDDIIENTDLALMLAAEARRGRFGVVTDFSYLGLSADGDTPGPLFGAADIGGFGVASDFTWQLLGTLGYRFNDRFSARAGYRHLVVDYEDDGFVWDVDLEEGISWIITTKIGSCHNR